MGLFDFGMKKSKGQINSERMARIREQGRAGENMQRLSSELKGRELVKVKKGADFKEYRRDLLTGKRKFIRYIENKSSKTAPIRPAQQKMHKKMKGRHSIIINNPNSYFE